MSEGSEVEKRNCLKTEVLDHKHHGEGQSLSSDAGKKERKPLWTESSSEVGGGRIFLGGKRT